MLSEGFEGVAGGSYFTGTTVDQFKLESGAVEVLAAGNQAGRCTGAGGSPTCINLAALPSTTFVSIAAFGPGTYDLTFSLAGSHVGQSPSTTFLFFGDLINVPIVVAAGDNFSTRSFLSITVAAGGLQPITFFEPGNSGAGNLLDNVLLVRRDSVTPTPEPSTAILFLVGLAGVGFFVKRTSRTTI